VVSNILKDSYEVALSVETRNHGQGENYEPVQLVKLFFVVSVHSVLCMQPDVLCFCRQRQVRRCQLCRKHGGWRR
jgi:hypothetical protein